MSNISGVPGVNERRFFRMYELIEKMETTKEVFVCKVILAELCIQVILHRLNTLRNHLRSYTVWIFVYLWTNMEETARFNV